MTIDVYQFNYKLVDWKISFEIKKPTNKVIMNFFNFFCAMFLNFSVRTNPMYEYITDIR